MQIWKAKKIVNKYKRDKKYTVDRKTFKMYWSEQFIPNNVLFGIIIKKKQKFV